MAAVLVLGVLIGRGSTLFTKTPPTPFQPTVNVALNEADAYQMTTDRYLVQTASLLVQLPKKMSGKPDSAFIERATRSLSELRLLMDSPAANKPQLRSLFEDLEMVLVQVVQMPKNGSATEATLIRQALEQRDVMPRLRDAVAETPDNF